MRVLAIIDASPKDLANASDHAAIGCTSAHVKTATFTSVRYCSFANLVEILPNYAR